MGFIIYIIGGLVAAAITTLCLAIRDPYGGWLDFKRRDWWKFELVFIFLWPVVVLLGIACLCAE